jgi:hypothetical protein
VKSSNSIFKIENVNGKKLNRVNFLNPFLSNDVVLAGGAMRSLLSYKENIADYDLFVLNNKKDKVKDLAKQILQAYNGQVIFRCKEGKLITVEIFHENIVKKIQIILSEHATVEQLLNSFDFNICRAAWDSEKVFFSPKFLIDFRKKEVTIHTITFPLASLKRLRKYSDKGYKTANAEYQFIQIVNTHQFDGESLKVRYID